MVVHGLVLQGQDRQTTQGCIAEPNARIKEIKLPSPLSSLYLLHVNVGQIPVNILTD